MDGDLKYTVTTLLSQLRAQPRGKCADFIKHITDAHLIKLTIHAHTTRVYCGTSNQCELHV